MAALQASIGYLDIALAYATVQIAEQLVEDSERFVAITQARAEAEVGSGADVARAEADAARAKQARIRAQGTWERSSVRLAVLLRWPPGRLLVPAESELRPDALVDPERTAALHQEALRARPDLRAAHARLQAAESQASAAWWDLLGPEIDAAARERLFGREIGDLDRTTLMHVFVRFSFSFEELGRLRTARATARIAQAREQALEDRVRGEIETALSNLRAAEAAVPEAQAAARATERSYQVEFARFEAGTGLGIEVIEAQNARARAQSDLAEAILRYSAAQMELAASIGQLSADLPGIRGRGGDPR
jgi:outer membrane protein TolC